MKIQFTDTAQKIAEYSKNIIDGVQTKTIMDPDSGAPITLQFISGKLAIATTSWIRSDGEEVLSRMTTGDNEFSSIVIDQDKKGML